MNTTQKAMPDELEQLRAQLESERAAHAAEVAGLRTLLQEWNDLAQHQGLSTQAHRNRTADALAAPPTAAVAAVEGMRGALEEMRSAAGRQECFVCGHELSQHLDKYGCEAGVGDPDIGAPCGCKGASTSEDMRPEIEALARADAALAAWKEATRG